MKILHALYWETFAGTEKVCTDLCSEMSKNNKVYLLSNKSLSKYTSKNVKLINVDLTKYRFNPLALYTIAKIIKKIQPDVIHCHNAKELEIFKYAQLFCDKKIPLVITRHNPVLKKKVALADLCVAVSDETYNFCNAKKNIIITNGIQFVKPKYVLNKENFNIVTASRLEPVKNIQNIIKALSQCKFDYRFYIIGDGSQRDNLKELIEKLQLDKKVFLLGYKENVHDYLYSSDMQIISSIEEGFSLSLIEGIVYGNLTLASNIANHEKILGKEFVFENNPETLGKKIFQAYDRYAQYKDNFMEVKSIQNKFDIQHIANNYIKEYKKLQDTEE